MKANSIKTILFSLVIVLNCSFASAQEEKDFIYDSKYDENEMLVSKTVYEKIDNSLSPKLQYQYKHDEQGRVIERIAYKWDSEDRQWKLNNHICCTYNEDDTVVIEYGRWDVKTKGFTQGIQKQQYSTVDAQQFLSIR